MNTSGIVFDVFDDFDGAVLRTIYPTADEVPALVKSAAAFSKEELDQLPDDSFALILRADTQMGPVEIRKYACVDPGNTDLSVRYFLSSGRFHMDPAMRKTAAENLLRFCDWYDLQPPEELKKEAVLGLAFRAVTAAPVIGGGYQEGKANLAAARLAAPGAILTPHEIEKVKTGEISHTNILADPQPSADPGQKPKASCIQKKSALRGRYPLDTAQHIKAACDYFETYASAMPLDDRREYCLNTLDRARELGVEVSEKVASYGSRTYAPDHVLSLGIEARKANILDREKRAQLDGLQAAAPSVDPGTYCGALMEFDKEAGLEGAYHVIPDPYLSTFGQKKIASFSETIDGRSIDEAGLKALSAGNGMKALEETFGKEVAKEFRADPVGIFQSMPRQQKCLIMRLADRG